jgi:predicted nucleic acid-binding protein
MPEIVINTGPIIALVAATGSLEWISRLYTRVWIPQEVQAEIAAGGPGAPELEALHHAGDAIRIQPASATLPQVLIRELDVGEASVIHTALEGKIGTVAIDEKAGRRIARLHGLKVTGSIGILVKARQQGQVASLEECLRQMRKKGIWISDGLIRQALAAVDESADDFLSS